MTQLGNKVFMYSFDYCNPRSFGILSLRAPFRGIAEFWLFKHFRIFLFQPLLTARNLLIFSVSPLFSTIATMRLTKRCSTWWLECGLTSLNTGELSVSGNFFECHVLRNPNGQYEDSTVFDFKWEPTSKEELTRFLAIHDKKCEMQTVYQDKRAEFWKKIKITSKNS